MEIVIERRAFSGHLQHSEVMTYGKCFHSFEQLVFLSLISVVYFIISDILHEVVIYTAFNTHCIIQCSMLLRLHCSIMFVTDVYLESFSHEHTDTPVNSSEVVVAMMSFQSKIINIKVSGHPCV